MATILLADDEDALRRALVRQLRAKGHTIVEARTGKQALDVLDETSVDVIVSDINMPEMDGMQLLRHVRERDSDMPVILLTGSPDVATAVKAVGYGAFEYLTKPGDLPRLADSVAKAVARREASMRRDAQEFAARARSPSRHPAAFNGTGSLVGGKYRIGRELGFGGMGTVYEAHREDLADMPVAVKVLHARHAGRPEQLLRFRREAEVVAKIHCTSIVKLIDFVSHEGGPHCLVMELLEGETLASAIADDAEFSEQRVAFIAVQVLAALAAAHAGNVMHRDLKPENVFLTRIAGKNDVVKLLDFGIAKETDNAPKLTETGIILGTPAYMAPEYARGESPSTRGDLYALGCVMYEALTKRQPFAAANYNALLFAIQEQTPRPISETRKDVSLELAAVIARAMAKDPDERFPNANAMAEALRPWSAWESPRETPRGGAAALAPTEESESRPLKRE